MIKGVFPVEKFKSLETPFYYYDMTLLRDTLRTIWKETSGKPYFVHYAVKANANPRILREIAAAGFGADCVSGNEILRALECGFPASSVVFAGVGKADKEILIGLDNDIYCFHVESIPEIEVIDQLATLRGKKARIALRINPNIDAHTHKFISTGREENKFGINRRDLPEILRIVNASTHLELMGIHFHIGSQITDLSSFENLCVRAIEVQEWCNEQGIRLPMINMGGGLGINYQHPNHCPMADFDSYFRLFGKYFSLQENQELHFELGRSVIAPSGSLISRVLFVKEGFQKRFLIIDAGMTELIRPALYQAFHHIENITSEKILTPYDVVGPICESSDLFAEARMINLAERGDLIAIRSAGAYGETMASGYNCRPLPRSYFSDTL